MFNHIEVIQVLFDHGGNRNVQRTVGLDEETAVCCSYLRVLNSQILFSITTSFIPRKCLDALVSQYLCCRRVAPWSRCQQAKWIRSDGATLCSRQRRTVCHTHYADAAWTWHWSSPGAEKYTNVDIVAMIWNEELQPLPTVSDSDHGLTSLYKVGHNGFLQVVQFLLKDADEMNAKSRLLKTSLWIATDDHHSNRDQLLVCIDHSVVDTWKIRQNRHANQPT